MKKSRRVNQIIILIIVLMSSISTFSQGFQSLDEVPHDITYYRETRITSPLVKAIYGRHSVAEGKEVFGTAGSLTPS